MLLISFVVSPSLRLRKACRALLIEVEGQERNRLVQGFLIDPARINHEYRSP